MKDIFDINRGKSLYTKSYCKLNEGVYPVYSANNNIPLDYRNNYDYDGKYLTCSINGIAGVITVLNDKFSINADRVIFIPKIINLDLEYIKYILEPLLRNITKGRKGLFEKNEFTKLNPEMIKEVEIPIPIENDKISLNIQNNVSQKYKIIDEIKNNLELKILDILNTDIEF
ncbi:restriction endonuclease subunit S [Mycoplasmopsis pullorum]|uniref:Restriction endonuclease subunit S n=1 Tax=Mycoplasmopsis pullorum TaxID=48003 RepID=A0A1L4FTB6_9BACT|nr:restriction endonuclease subunit S [Mycoplasmopsis pullorum]